VFVYSSTVGVLFCVDVVAVEAVVREGWVFLYVFLSRGMCVSSTIEYRSRTEQLTAR
jgi:hypothetical protein